MQICSFFGGDFFVIKTIPTVKTIPKIITTLKNTIIFAIVASSVSCKIASNSVILAPRYSNIVIIKLFIVDQIVLTVFDFVIPFIVDCIASPVRGFW